MSTSPINAAKNMQGFVSASQRKRCGTCHYMRNVGQLDLQMQCRKGGFFVTAYSTCQQYQVVQPHGFKTPGPI